MSSQKRLLQIVAWLAVAAWAVVIFSMSNQVSEQSSEISKSTTQILFERFFPSFNELTEGEQIKLVSGAEYAVRKVAHISEYFILSALVITALLFNKLNPLKRAGMAVLMSVLYASTDEIHQLFVEGRSGKIADVLVDTIGIIIAAGLYLIIVNLIKRRKKKDFG